MKNKTNKTVTHGTDSYSIPFMIVCTISGLTKTYTSEEYINGKLDRFGGLEKLRQTYVCRDAAKLKKAGKTDAEIKEILNRPKVSPVVPAAEVKTEEVKVETNVAEAKPAESAAQPAESAAPVIPAETPVSIAETPKAEEPVVEQKKPIAKQCKDGSWRNSKGYPINKLLLNNYECIAYVEPVEAAS